MEKTLDIIWKESAKELGKTIVLPEASFSERIVKAGIQASEERIAKIVFLVKNDDDLDKYDLVENDYLKVINITTHEIKEMLVSALFEKRKEKSIDKSVLSGYNDLRCLDD